MRILLLALLLVACSCSGVMPAEKASGRMVANFATSADSGALALDYCVSAGTTSDGTVLKEEGSMIARTPNFLNLLRQVAPGEYFPPANRKMIYTASFSVLVPSIEESVQQFRKLIQESGGYLSNQTNSSYTFRVPAGDFDKICEKARAMGKVLSETMQAQDVTKQYMDLSIRLENAEKSRARLLALLEKAEKVEDILKIEEQLRRLTTEIESMKGELKYLKDRIAMSLITVEFQSNAPRVIRRPRQAKSRFWWINEVGIEQVLRRF